MRAWGFALCLVVSLCPRAATAQGDAPPTLECGLGFDGLRTAAQAMPGAQFGKDGPSDLVTLSQPDAWTVHIMFTAPGHPAHPAVTLRTLRKQVTDVWTADSKGCGYGDSGQFAVLMSDMKAGDTAMTNASRHEVEQKKQDQSPLGAPQ